MLCFPSGDRAATVRRPCGDRAATVRRPIRAPKSAHGSNRHNAPRNHNNSQRFARCSRRTRCLRCSRCSRCTRCRVTSRRVVSRRRSRICIFVAVGVVVVVGLRRAAASGSAYFHIAFVLSRPRFPSSHASVYDFTYFSNIRRNLHQSVTDWCRFSPYI